MDLTSKEHEIVRLGLASDELLQNDSLLLAIQAIHNDCFCAFTETKPHEASKRENAYNMYQGLQAIEAQLRHYVQAKDEITRKLDASHEDQDEF